METIALVGQLTVYVREVGLSYEEEDARWEVLVLDAAGNPVDHSIEGTFSKDVAQERARHLAGNLISSPELHTYEAERGDSGESAV